MCVCTPRWIGYPQHDRDRTISRLETELIGVNEALIRAQERAGDAVGAYEQARVEMQALRQAIDSRHMDRLVRRRVWSAALSARACVGLCALRPRFPPHPTPCVATSAHHACC